MASDDVRDFLTALSAARVDYVVVGAHALAAHGLVRATGDLDVLVAPTPANARRLERAIQAFAGASLEYFGVSVEALSRPRVGFFMGVEPDRIDVMTRIAGVGFERAKRGSVRARLEGTPVRVLGLDERISAKRASAKKRPASSPKAKQDDADLAWLLAERARLRKIAR
jgi:hypothetical protein